MEHGLISVLLVNLLIVGGRVVIWMGNVVICVSKMQISTRVGLLIIIGHLENIVILRTAVSIAIPQVGVK